MIEEVPDKTHENNLDDIDKEISKEHDIVSEDTTEDENNTPEVEHDSTSSDEETL